MIISLLSLVISIPVAFVLFVLQYSVLDILVVLFIVFNVVNVGLASWVYFRSNKNFT